MKARITRIPLICSRSTRFRLSRLVCIRWNRGETKITSSETATPSTATLTAMIHDSPKSSRTAMTKPPTIMMGAPTMMVRVVWTIVCTCRTSLVLRVSSDEAPKSRISRVENDRARSKMAALRSRPSDMAVRAPNQVAPICPAACTRENSSIRAPLRQIRSVSPFTTPSSMICAFRFGRYSDMAVASTWRTRMASSSLQYGFRYVKISRLSRLITGNPSCGPRRGRGAPGWRGSSWYREICRARTPSPG